MGLNILLTGLLMMAAFIGIQVFEPWHPKVSEGFACLMLMGLLLAFVGMLMRIWGA